MDSFSSLSGNLFAILIYYLELGNVGSGVVVGNTVFVICIGDVTIVFFYPIFQTPDGFFYVRMVAIFF